LVGSGTGPLTVAPVRFGGLDDFLGGSVDEAMVESLEADADVLVGHLRIPSKERPGS
jgi:hypothetical protein